MKVQSINKSHTNFVKFGSSDSSKRKINPTGKEAALMLAALTMLASYSKADLIDIKRASYEAAEKEYARLKKYDADDSGFLDDAEQAEMNKNSVSNNVVVTESNFDETQTQKQKDLKIKAEKLINMLNGLNPDGTKNNSFWNNNKGNAEIQVRKMSAEEFIEIYKINPSILNKLNVTTCYPDMKILIIDKLVDYRFKNLPENFTVINNFERTSGLFEERIEKGLFKDSPTGKFDIAKDFKTKVEVLSKNKALREIYANNFAIVLKRRLCPYNIYDNYDHNNIIRFLIPSE